MSLRSPRKLAVEGIQENHMGTKAQTFSPKDAAGTGVMAPECTSKLDSGVIEARVVVPEKISKLAVEVRRTGVLQVVERPGVAVLAAVGVVAKCAQGCVLCGGGSKGSSKTSGSGPSCSSLANEKSKGCGTWPLCVCIFRSVKESQSRSRSRCSFVLRRAAFSARSSASSRSNSSSTGTSEPGLRLEDVLQTLSLSSATGRCFAACSSSPAAHGFVAGTSSTTVVGGALSTGHLRTKSLWLLDTTSSIFGCSTLSASVDFVPEDCRHSTR
mmetsp:Transcript_51285/g.153332  ORF Transcript_51285/g.153332 Transcript_51285/m.153332 type:complete len:270 (-) Transcript_51285:620-1429(-)